MTDKKSTNQESNLYLPSVLGLLLILIAAAVVWVGQVSPSVAEQATVEPAAAPAQTEQEPIQAEQAPAQASVGDQAAGRTLFTQTCSACHGPTGQGIQGLGKDLTKSEFVAGQTDIDLLTFIKVGRGPTDLLNTTGIAMPPKGGNPALGEEDLQNIVAFLRTIHK
ncbi:MAG: c-type cytochrome [Chloroflexi bacterium]|nr:c-type cytochrome [Chloroflexota bacterium]